MLRFLAPRLRLPVYGIHRELRQPKNAVGVPPGILEWYRSSAMKSKSGPMV
jgi:hypothetical protein